MLHIDEDSPYNFSFLLLLTSLTLMLQRLEPEITLLDCCSNSYTLHYHFITTYPIFYSLFALPLEQLYRGRFTVISSSQKGKQQVLVAVLSLDPFSCFQTQICLSSMGLRQVSQFKYAIPIGLQFRLSTIYICMALLSIKYSFNLVREDTTVKVYELWRGRKMGCEDPQKCTLAIQFCLLLLKKVRVSRVMVKYPSLLLAFFVGGSLLLQFKSIIILSNIHTLYQLTMHKSNVSRPMQQSQKVRFQSTNKENCNTQKGQTSPCIKEDIYHKKLMEMYHKYSKIEAQNGQRLAQLREKAFLYRTISQRQAVKLQSSQITMAKEEYMAEIISNKDDIYRMQQLITTLTEEHQTNKSANSALLARQSQTRILHQSQLIKIQKQIVEMQKILHIKKCVLLQQKQKMDSEREQLRVLQQMQGRYLGLMCIIDSKQRSKQ